MAVVGSRSCCLPPLRDHPLFKKWFGKKESGHSPSPETVAKDKNKTTAGNDRDTSAKSARQKSSDQASHRDSDSSRPTDQRSTHRAKQNQQKSREQKPREQKPREQKPWSLDQFPVPEKDGFTRFHDLDLQLPLMHAIADLGFEYCSPIQAAVLPHTLDGYDAVGKAQTGTGKTAAFLLTAINDLLENDSEQERFVAEPRVVVIAPTRELTMQIGADAEDLTKHTQLSVVTLIGGMDYSRQHEKIKRRLVDIVVATPGRLIDFMTRGDLSLDQVDILIIDEADRMLDMGFIPQVRRIVRATPKREDRQTLLFSATFTDDVLSLTEQWTNNPIKIEMEPDQIAADSVDQKVYMMSSSDKLNVLKAILNSKEVTSAIVFANRRDQTRRVFEKLRKNGFACGMLSGEVSQQKRTSTLKQFKEGKIKILVATDVAGRGIHVDGISHVINYNLPEDPEDYVHRIGRTGRAGALGTSISLACEDDAFMLPDIEELLGQKLSCEQPPESLMVEG